jgi:hypothetical protein
MQIKFNQLPNGIQRHYLSTAQIAKVEVFEAAGSLGPEWYRITFANGTVREWRYQQMRGSTTASHWMMSTPVTAPAIDPTDGPHNHPWLNPLG